MTDAFDDGDRVMTLPQVCERAQLSRTTFKREIAAGRGPKIVRLSERRLGVRVRDYRDWLDRKSEKQA